MLDLKWALVEKCISHLLGAQVEVYTDNMNLTLWKQAKLGAIEQRWVAEMAKLNYEIKHKPGWAKRKR